MRRFLILGLLLGGCGLQGGDGTDSGKEPWRPGPLGGKADDTIVDKGSLAFGAAVKGVTINKNELHRFTFFAIQGADILVEMSADAGSGSPDTYLQLETPGGKIYTDDDGGAGLNSRLEQLGLPESGTYTLYATTYRRAGSGDYSLSLSCLSGTCAVTPQMKTDDDHDGYAELDGDCDDTTPDRSPAAPEIPGNNKDDNCDGKVDEGCNDPTSCDRPPRAPQAVKIQGNLYGYSYKCRVTGQAEPGTKLTVHSNSRRQTLLSSGAVPTSGSFSFDLNSNCYPGDVLVLSVADQASQSGKVWHVVSGSDGVAPLAAAGVVATVQVQGQVVIEGTTELGATVLLTNTSQGGAAVEAPAGAGFETAFKGALAASAGDWIKVQPRDAASNLGPATHVQVPGADASAPASPTGVGAQGNLYGYSYKCRVTGQAEPYAKLTVHSNARRQTLLSGGGVPASGSFSFDLNSNCYPGDVLVLWVSDGANASTKVTATVSGSDGVAPLAPDSAAVSPVQAGQVTVTGKGEINGKVVVHNDTQGGGPVSAATSWSGLEASFSAQIGADAGDWLRVQLEDAAGNLGPASMLKVPGADASAPASPTGVGVQGNLYGYSYKCRVTGQAEPYAKLTVHSNARRQTLLSGGGVPASGSFSFDLNSNCYPGDVLVLWVSDGANPSAKITATVSGSDGVAPLAPDGAAASAVQGGQVTVTGKGEINGKVVIHNDTQNSAPVSAATSWSGLEASFSAQIGADAGDWLRVQLEDAAGNLGPASMIKVSGSDTSGPAAPVGVGVQGNLYGYSYKCRVTGQAEPYAKLTVHSNARRQTLLSGGGVPASGSFSFDLNSNCYPGDVLVLWVSDGANPSAKITATVSGSDGVAPLAPDGAAASAVQGGQVTVTGKGEINGKAVVHNDTKNSGPISVATSWTGLEASFSAQIGADAGDWLRVQLQDAAGNLGPASMLKVPGSDASAPAAPTGVGAQGNLYGYSYKCRVTGQAEPYAKLTIYSDARRQTLLSSGGVPASGSFSFDLNSNCYPGDVLVLWVSDGANTSAKVTTTVSGNDGVAPLAPASVSVSAVQGGQVTVTATVEINGSLIVTNTYDNSTYSAPAGADGSATVILPAWHGDQLKVESRDAAGNVGPAVFKAVP